MAAPTTKVETHRLPGNTTRKQMAKTPTTQRLGDSDDSPTDITANSQDALSHIATVGGIAKAYIYITTATM